MVDSISGLGNVQNISGGAKKASTVEDSKKTQDTKRGDEVSISQEALSLQAEKEAAAVREKLAANTDATLGLKSDFQE